ncbi:MAG: SDR family oxidoreductase [Bacteroidia bacterium]|nr:SDR family oxidoreductase [Bacteroidia bacterium]
MERKLQVVVTGASSGIGYWTAYRFAVDHGADVIAMGRRANQLESLRKKVLEVGVKGKIHPIQIDLEEAENDSIYNNVYNHFKSVDILINNAGVLIKKPLLEITRLDLERTYRVNTFSQVSIVQALFPLIREGGTKHIINISSIGGILGTQKFSGLSAYSSSKGAVGILTECMAEELKEFDIKVNGLAFGAVQTEMLSSAFPGYIAPISDVDISRFVVDFAINGHQYFNGKVLPVSSSNP